MGLGNLQLLVEVTAYLLAFIVSLFIFIPVGVVLNDFNHHCPLYTTGKWNYNLNSTRTVFHANWGDVSACNFPIFMGVISFPIAFFYLVWMSCHLFKNTDASWLGAFLTLITNITVSFLMFIAALILSIGYNKFCDALLKPPSPISECELAEYDNPFEDEFELTENFSILLGMAQFGAWSSFIVWLFVTVCAGLRIYQYHSQEGIGTSMRRERERILQRVGARSYSSASEPI